MQWLRPMEAQLYGAREEQQRGLAEVHTQQDQLWPDPALILTYPEPLP